MSLLPFQLRFSVPSSLLRGDGVRTSQIKKLVLVSFVIWKLKFGLVIEQAIEAGEEKHERSMTRRRFFLELMICGIYVVRLTYSFLEFLFISLLVP